MRLIDLIEVEKIHSEMPQEFKDATSQRTPSEITQGLNTAHSQDVEHTPSQCEKKSRFQDTLGHSQIEAHKDVKSADEALLLLRNLRDGSQISDTAHDSLSQAFKLLCKGKEEPAAHSGKKDGTQPPSVRRHAEVVDEEKPRASGINVPKRKSASRPFKHPSSKRQQLTSEEAAEIYSMRPKVAKDSILRKGCMVKSKMIAPHFGVTSKTVRDIWHGRTWVAATRHLWTEGEIALRAKGAVESDEEDKNDSPASACPTSSMDKMKMQNPAKTTMAGQFASLPAISSLQNQAMMEGLSALLFQPAFGSSVPSEPAHHFSPVGQQQAAKCGLLFNGLAQQHRMVFAGCHPGFGMGAHNLVLPEVSPSLQQLKNMPN